MSNMSRCEVKLPELFKIARATNLVERVFNEVPLVSLLRNMEVTQLSNIIRGIASLAHVFEMHPRAAEGDAADYLSA